MHKLQEFNELSQNEQNVRNPQEAGQEAGHR